MNNSDAITLLIDREHNNGYFNYVTDLVKIKRNIELLGVDIKEPEGSGFNHSVNYAGRYICVIRLSKNPLHSYMMIFDHTVGKSVSEVQAIAKTVLKNDKLVEYFMLNYQELHSGFDSSRDSVSLSSD